MKNLVVVALMMISAISFAQNERSLKLNQDTNTIDVVYYHDNGQISQTGAYTLDGKLHGEWLSYDVNGKKIVSAIYDNGKKTGKWFFWSDSTLKEVDYSNNVIASVNEWTKSSSVALRN